MSLFTLHRVLMRAAVACGVVVSALALARVPAAAATLTWDANASSTGPQDGAGTWNTTTSNWWNGTTNVLWTNGDDAIFGDLGNDWIVGGTGQGGTAPSQTSNVAKVDLRARDDEADAAVLGQAFLMDAEAAQPLGARALEKAQVIRVIDHAAAVRVFIIDANVHKTSLVAFLFLVSSCRFQVAGVILP